MTGHGTPGVRARFIFHALRTEAVGLIVPPVGTVESLRMTAGFGRGMGGIAAVAMVA